MFKMYESSFERKYENDFDCAANHCGPPPPMFNIPPPPRSEFVELYKCSENLNDYGLCGAITIIDSGFHNSSSTQTSAMILLCSVLLLIIAFISSIVIWNHKRKNQVYLSSSHKGANNGSRHPDSNIMTLPQICLTPDRTFMRQHPLNIEINFAQSLRSHPPPLFICSSPGPDPYRSFENVYEELEHEDREYFVMHDREITSEEEFRGDVLSLPEDAISTSNSINDTSENQEHPKSNSEFDCLNSNRNFNTCSKLLRRTGIDTTRNHDSMTVHADSSNNRDLRTLNNRNQMYRSKRNGQNVVEHDLNNRKFNSAGNAVNSRKNSVQTFSEFEMQFQPKVNSNFYVPSHEIMSKRQNSKYKTTDNQIRNSTKRNHDYFFQAPQMKDNFTYDQFNNNGATEIEIYQQPEFSKLQNYHDINSPNHPLYNNSTALSSDSGYSQNTHTSEGTLESQSKNNSNGNIFILPATSKNNRISHIHESHKMT